jgi:hypothetical protein
MQFKWLGISVGAILCITLFSCAITPKARQLDKSEITDAVPVFSGSYMTRADLFGDKINKEMFQALFKNNAETIKQFVYDKYQITLDDTAFIGAIADIEVIQTETIGSGAFSSKRYYWAGQEKPPVYAELMLLGVIGEDGSMPLELTIRKDDPEYAPGYALKMNLSIAVK